MKLKKPKVGYAIVIDRVNSRGTRIAPLTGHLERISFQLFGIMGLMDEKLLATHLRTKHGGGHYLLAAYDGKDRVPTLPSWTVSVRKSRART